MKVDGRLAAAAARTLEALMREVRGVVASVISTEDGFEVASQVGSAAEAARLSAMASSMAALGAMAVEENHLGACRDILIEGAGGHIVMLQVRRSDISLVLSVVANRDAVVGQVLYFSRQAAGVLEAA